MTRNKIYMAVLYYGTVKKGVMLPIPRRGKEENVNERSENTVRKDEKKIV